MGNVECFLRIVLFECIVTYMTLFTRDLGNRGVPWGTWTTERGKTGNGSGSVVRILKSL